MRLSAQGARALGSLVEKELTTPQQYPLTVNSLVAACNQASNRDPVVDYDEQTVMSVLDELRAQRLVRFVLPSHGRSVVRYRHVLDEAWGLDARQCALLCVLLLRGPQTIGELRLRSDRMVQFEGLDEVDHELDLLASLEQPLVERLARRAGQKEERWACPLVEPSPLDGTSERAGVWSGAADLTDDLEGHQRAYGRAGDRVEGLASELASLRSEVNELRRELDTLRASLGG